MLKLALLMLYWRVFTAGQSNQDCPLGWEAFAGQCYMFAFYPFRQYSEAFSACQLDGAHLLSVNSNNEHNFVSQWLTQHDMTRENRWWTSGVGAVDTLQWEGDGSKATLDQAGKWTSDEQANLQPNLHVVYTFTTVNNQFLWSRQLSAQKSPYVCEISVAQAFRINQARRDFTFGTDIIDPALVPRGPHFNILPQSIVVVGNKETSFLECAADGNPSPSYIWYRVETGGDVAVTSQLDARYSLINGRFSFQHPDQMKDAGRYYCEAFNEFGKIITPTVTISFGHLGEFSNDPPGSVAALQYQGTYLQCLPPNYNPRLDYQWYKGPGAQFIRPELNHYLFVSNNGRLYFSETQISDAGMYHCVVTLVAPLGQSVATGQAPSRTSLGIQLTIKGDSANQFNPTIHNDFPAVFPTPALRGVTVRLECFAYGRLPLYYTWRRDNGPIPGKAQLIETNQNRILLIPDAQLEDSGNYTCRVEQGTQAADEKSIALVVEALPFFPFPLRDQHVDIGTTFTLLCQAMAVPLPTYAWYKNGQPLTSDPGNVEVKVNVVTFLHADPARHNGMYQCSATNLHGTSVTSAQVRVLEFKPSFSKKPLQVSHMATAGGNVTILCQPEAAPTPTFTWSHNGQPLSLTPGGGGQGRLTLLDNGNLLISPVQMTDQGQYTCTAENTQGSASSHGLLVVVTKTTLTSVPRNTEVIANDTAFLTCQASYDPRHTDLAYTWSFNGYPIASDPHIRQATHEGLEGLYIINAQFQHDGVYECAAVTVDDSVTATAYLSVKGPPSEPAGIYGHHEGNDVILYWSAGASHGSPVIYYVIELNSIFRPEWRVKEKELRAADAVSPGFEDKLTFRVTDLSPGSMYNFRVKAVNQFGISGPSFPSSTFKVPDSAPLVAPKGIRNKISTAGTLSFEWDPLSPEDFTGDGLGYTVFWRKKHPETLFESIWESTTVDAATASHVAVVGVENYYLEYEVMVCAFNSLGTGPNSTITVVMSQEDLPMVTATNVGGSGINGTAMMVTWDPIDTRRTSLKGALLGVQINYWWMTDSSRLFSVNIYCPPNPEECVQGEVIGLDFNGDFWVNTQVYNTAGLGPMGENQLVSTFYSAPLLYPEYVSIHSMDGKRVYVQWRGVPVGILEEALKGYKIWWWPASDNILTANVTVIKGKITWGVLEGIQENTLYALRVLGYNKGGDGKKSPTVYFTLEGQIAYNPQTTEVLAAGSCITSSLGIIIMSQLLNWFIYV